MEHRVGRGARDMFQRSAHPKRSLGEVFLVVPWRTLSNPRTRSYRLGSSYRRRSSALETRLLSRWGDGPMPFDPLSDSSTRSKWCGRPDPAGGSSRRGRGRRHRLALGLPPAGVSGRRLATPWKTASTTPSLRTSEVRHPRATRFELVPIGPGPPVGRCRRAGPRRAPPGDATPLEPAARGDAFPSLLDDPRLRTPAARASYPAAHRTRARGAGSVPSAANESRSGRSGSSSRPKASSDTGPPRRA